MTRSGPGRQNFCRQERKPTNICRCALANRHGLATGATGTGKTVTLQVLAEGFSRAGVPVFAADIKGDLSGIAARGEAKPISSSAPRIWASTTSPMNFRSCSGTCSASRAIRSAPPCSRWARFCCRACSSLNDVQEGIINIAFRFADDDPSLAAAESKGLVDLKDLRELLAYIGERTPRRSARATATSP